jgi:hypothetical protein
LLVCFSFPIYVWDCSWSDFLMYSLLGFRCDVFFRNRNIFIILCNSLSLLFLMRFLIIFKFKMFLHCRKVLFCCVIEFCFFPVFRNISWSRISSCIFKDCQSLKTANEFFINKRDVYDDVTEWVSPVKCLYLYFGSVDNFA